MKCMHTEPNKIDLKKLSNEIREWSKELGFTKIGITDIQLGKHEEYLKQMVKKRFSWRDGIYETSREKKIQTREAS